VIKRSRWFAWSATNRVFAGIPEGAGATASDHGLLNFGSAEGGPSAYPAPLPPARVVVKPVAATTARTAWLL
jgi:hypothetical protein